MEFRFTAEEEAFRSDVREFLKEELPPGWQDQFDSDTELLTEQQSKFGRQFNKKLAQRRWLTLPGPLEYGGLKASSMQQMIYNEEMAYNGAPTGLNMGVAWVGPSLMIYGTDEQKKRFLPAIANHEEIWCTLYSEPGPPKHKGISMFILPMNTPGITVRPLVNMASMRGFNEVFFEDARIPANYIVGLEINGWYQLAVALDFERSSVAGVARARRWRGGLV